MCALPLFILVYHLGLTASPSAVDHIMFVPIHLKAQAGLSIACECMQANMADFMELTSHELHGLMRAYGLLDSNAAIESQRAAFGRFIGLHRYCKG